MDNDSSPSAIAAELGERLKRARLNLNLTPAEIAYQVGVSRKTALNAEKRHCSIGHFRSYHVSTEFNWPIGNILTCTNYLPLTVAKTTGEGA